MVGIDMRNKIKKLFKYFKNCINLLNSLYSWIQKKIIIFLYLFFGALSVISFIALFYVMFSDAMTIQKLLDTGNKKETIQFIGFGISGLIGFIAVISLTRRANALDGQNKLVEKGHVQDRFKLAIDHLGDVNNQTIRIASFYELYNLACDNENLRQDIFEILCAHMRKTTRTENYKHNIAKDEPTEEMQSLLDVLFKKQKNTFGCLSANLQKVYLVGANLDNAHLENANLSGASLENANLLGAHLENATLKNVHLEHANLENANLDNANLEDAYLKHATLMNAHLKNAYLINTNLEHADLYGAKLNNTWLHNANLENASIGRADLHKATISGDTKMPDGWKKEVLRMPDCTINEPHGRPYT